MTTARSWREYPRRYRYEAAVCDKCGKWHFPPRLVCDSCHGEKFTGKAMRRTGKILTHTVIRTPPAMFKDESPYAIAIVEMDDGPRVTTQFVGYTDDQLKIGQKIKLEFRKVQAGGDAGTILYGYKAVPI